MFNACLTAHSDNSSFIFQCRVFIFITMITCGMKIRRTVSEHLYDIGVKSQGHIYFKPVYGFLMQNLAFFINGAHIWHADCLWCVKIKMKIDKETLFIVAYKVTDNIISQAILRHNTILN